MKDKQTYHRINLTKKRRNKYSDENALHNGNTAAGAISRKILLYDKLPILLILRFFLKPFHPFTRKYVFPQHPR